MYLQHISLCQANIAHLRQESHNSKIRHSWVVGIERNVCRCTFNRRSVITHSSNSPLESSCVVVALIENDNTSKPLKDSEKSQILSCDTHVANEACIYTQRTCMYFSDFHARFCSSENLLRYHSVVLNNTVLKCRTKVLSAPSLWPNLVPIAVDLTGS